MRREAAPTRDPADDDTAAIGYGSLVEETAAKDGTAGKDIRRSFGYLRPYKGLSALTLLVTIADALVPLLAPWPLKIMVDNVLGGHPLPPLLSGPLGPLAENRVALLALVIAAGVLIQALGSGLTVINTYLRTRIEQGMVLDFRSDLFQHAGRLSLAFHDQRRTGDFMNRINLQSNAIGAIPMTVPLLAQSLITLIGMFVVALFIHPYLAVLSLVVVPFLYYSIAYYAKRISPRVKKVRMMEGQSLSILHEAMSMLRVIMAFGREGYHHARFRRQGETALRARVRLTVGQTLFDLAVSLTTAAGTALVLGFGAYFVIQGELTVGQLLVVIAYIGAVYTPLQVISGAIGPIQEHLISLRMAFELLDAEPDIREVWDAVEFEEGWGYVGFDHVHFSYTGRKETLSDISFKVAPGQLVGVVGPTGAGKSTLVSLIPRFYDLQEGRVMVDGIDVRHWKLAALRDQISVVLQEPLLFHGSIANNIRYGRLDASLKEVMEAAKAANAHEFIMRLPKKYDTIVGERGSRLSGGERQRISVARAFLKSAPILILDEPTSSVDSKTEAVILEALQRLAEGKTTFMIAHRLSTLWDADMILVMSGGRIVERGTHEELLQQDGLYRQMHDAQTAPGIRRRTRHDPPVAAPQLRPLPSPADRTDRRAAANES